MREAGIVVPELKWPSMPLMPSSTSFCATVVPVRGSAWSSAESSTMRTCLPPITGFVALNSSTASVMPFWKSLP
ncbi:hypothetical protein OKW27_005816 [Paraburkholderia sp. 35.1]